VTETWIFNASPLIALGKSGALDILPKLCDQVLVPRPVHDEIEAGPADDPARSFLASPGIRVIETPMPDSALEQWGLGSGETSVIAAGLANERARVVLDDALARRAARAMAVPCIGTLGIVLRAAAGGVVPDARILVSRLQSAGLYLDEGLIDQALREMNQGN
jgi:predicted nucleic acid-binding protein